MVNSLNESAPTRSPTQAVVGSLEGESLRNPEGQFELGVGVYVMLRSALEVSQARDVEQECT